MIIKGLATKERQKLMRNLRVSCEIKFLNATIKLLEILYNYYETHFKSIICVIHKGLHHIFLCVRFLILVYY